MHRRHIDSCPFAAALAAAVLIAVSAAPARAQGNSTAARWAVENLAPGSRGQVVKQAAHGTSVIPTSTATPTQTFTATATASPTNTLPPTECGARPDGSTCDAGLDFGNTLVCIDGECVACVPDDDAAPRFVDNGDRTITDRKTCWVWEKKTSGTAFPHGVDLKFKYSEPGVLCNDCAGDPCPPDGTAFTVFLAALNFGRFAGHGDWRIPTGDGRQPIDPDATEMESLFTTDDGNGLCIDPLFSAPCPGASEAEESWLTNYADGSATTISDYDPTRPAWYHGAMSYRCSTSLVGVNYKIDPIHFRAVRGGIVFVP